MPEEKKKEEKKEDKKAEMMDFRNLKTGEYVLHIYVQETRGLVHPTDNSSTVDPLIKFQGFGQTKNTAAKKNKGTGMVYWGEHTFFTKIFQEAAEFEIEKLKISVLDHGLIGSDALIGEFEIDLLSIYFTEKHALEHVWIALSNMEKNFDEIKGFLKFSVNVVATGDDQITLEDEKTVKKQSDADIQKRVLMPPQIQTQGYEMQIDLIKAESLVKMDGFMGSIDSYVIFEFGHNKMKSPIIKDNLNPTYGKTITIPYTEPSINDLLTVKVYDWDQVGSDEIVGSASFSKKEIATGSLKKPFWLNIYGAQLGDSTDYAKVMNSQPILGTFWKGRVLLGLSCFQKDNPEGKITGVDDEIMKEYRFSDPVKWKIQAEVFYGLSLPEKDEKYKVQVRWADQEINFDNAKPQNGVWEWFDRKDMTCKFPYQKSHELPDVLIYICEGKKRLTFIRKTAKSLMNPDAEPSLFYFKKDRSVDKDIRDDLTGIIKMRVCCGMEELLQDKSIGNWDQSIKRPKTRQGYLYANIYHAQNLLATDDNGVSDPFVVVNYYGVEKKTQVIDDTLNPIWYERHELTVPLFDLEDSPPIVIKVFDDDTFGCDFMGGSVLDLSKGIKEGYLKYNSTEFPEPKWVDLYYNRATKSGRLLLSFNLFEAKPQGISNYIAPPTDTYFMKIRILGLRNLQSLGLLPVKRPFIKFDTNSLRPRSSDKDTLSESKAITTEPKEGGSDPNICTIIQAEIKLPTQLAYCPSLSVAAFDCILKGFSQPMLGSFSIDLPAFIQKSRDTMEIKFTKASQILSMQRQKDERTQDEIDLIESSGQKGGDSRIDKKDKVTPSDLQEGTDEKKKLLGEEEEKIPEDPNQKPLEGNLEMQNIKIPGNQEEIQVEKKVIRDDGTIDTSLMIFKSKYQTDPDTRKIVEFDEKPESHYYGLGYDPISERLNEDTRKHYRYFIDDILENSPFMNKNTFDEFDLMRGKKISGDAKALGQQGQSKAVGKFKGWIEILSQKDKLKYEGGDVGKLISEMSKKEQEKFDKEFMAKTMVMIRVYITRAENLAQVDDDSLSDPYIKIKIGKNSKDNAKDYIEDVTNADFYRKFDLRTELPGPSQLQVQVWDHDEIVSDDLIGETIIDLENRFFSNIWRKIVDPPIETRKLYTPYSTMCRGKIKLWVEIIPVTELDLIKREFLIQPKPKMEFELRVVVWECHDVPAADIEDCSDLYITGSVGDKTLSTDTHYRSMDGTGSFNWRMVFPIMLPNPDPNITFQIWDRDLLSANDYISEATFNFTQEALQAFEDDQSVKIYGTKNKPVEPKKDDKKGGAAGKDVKKTTSKEEKFTITLMNAEKPGFTKQAKVGNMVLSFELMPKNIADTNKVGLGRDEPNHDPWCPPPVGRFEFSFNPFVLFTRLVGPKARRKCYLICCCLLCIVIAGALVPIVFGNIVGNILS